MPTKPRYLTKSRFKLGSECPAKLYYTGKKSAYADQSLDDPFLAALASGGFQVGELAKCYFPGGHDITSLDYEESLEQTRALLQLDDVVIFEAAFLYQNLFIRADIIEKSGNRIKLIEVKAKSCDPSSHSQFENKNGTIKAQWLPYLEDVAFQKYVMTNALPGMYISAELMLADKSASCPTEGLNQKFLITTDQNGRKSVECSDLLNEDDLSTHILCRIPVDHYCEDIYQGRASKTASEFSFEERIKSFSDHYSKDIKISSPISKDCKSCQFQSSGINKQAGLKSGFEECWAEQLGWQPADFDEPTVLDVWNCRKKQKFIDDGIYKIAQLSEDDIKPEPDGSAGLSSSERQWLQVEKVINKENSPWIDSDSLAREIQSWKYPLHFIDFETSMAAIPFHAGMHPYEGIAFQFSHHMVPEDGTVTHAGEYLNTETGKFPNFEFVRQLMNQLAHDNGSIFMYSPHENTYLNTIYRQLKDSPTPPQDRDELCAFIRSITVSKNDSTETWAGERAMIDMLRVVKRFYYDPATNGSNSIKYVLPAILNSSDFLKNKYSKPIYGAPDGISSLNFNDWTWVKLDQGRVIDPYQRLPKLFQGISKHDHNILSEDTELKNGGAALVAYTLMQSEKMSDYERYEIERALLKYCELDTLAMVMIFEAWRDMIESS